jgi:hypothetical protein
VICTIGQEFVIWISLSNDFRTEVTNDNFL